MNLNSFDNRFEEAVNVGSPVNSPFDDFGLYLNTSGLDGFYIF